MAKYKLTSDWVIIYDNDENEIDRMRVKNVIDEAISRIPNYDFFKIVGNSIEVYDNKGNILETKKIQDLVKEWWNNIGQRKYQNKSTGHPY